MRQATLRPLSFALLALFGSSALAVQIPIRPGLWEMTTRSGLLALAPQVPPDQMQQWMDMAKQHGVEIPRIENGAATSRLCVTPEMAARDISPVFAAHQTGCAVRNTTRAGNTYTIEFACDNPQVQGSGTAVAKFADPQGFTGHTEFHGTAQGAPLDERAEVSGRWIGADCGDLPPPK